MGIVGLPNVGKSTLFNALTQAAAEAANYPFCTIEPNIGIVPIPDERLQRIAGVVRPEKLTPAAIQFIDIAGLVRGASRGEGLGNQFLAHIREVDALVHVIRCFPDDNVSHVEGDLDPLRDKGIVETELLLADLQTLEKRQEKVSRYLKTGEDRYKVEFQLIQRLTEHINGGNPARTFPVKEDERPLLREYRLLTSLPVLYCANVSGEELPDIIRGKESGPSGRYYRELAEAARKDGAACVAVAAQLEAELQELEEDERREFLEELGISEPGLNRLVKAAYLQLDLVTFYTIKGPETRAWIVPRGTKAPQAAGRIHSDMERGFIRAEVLSAEELIEAGSFGRAREMGIVRSEGRDYEVQDGDVLLIRFNV
ncbi:MAG TPA: redox-regulated ATPase YchF [Firmicutes bacterium]|nr:redox-regulated ATPase YchF [Bacillota bacterium]